MHGGFDARRRRACNDLWLLRQFGWKKLHTDPYCPSQRAGHTLTLLPALSTPKKTYFLLTFGAASMTLDMSSNAVEGPRFARDSVWLLQVKLQEDQSCAEGKPCEEKRYAAKWSRCVLDSTQPNLLLHQRVFHSATLLPDGRILVTGGRDGEGKALADACFLSPVTANGKHWTVERAVLFPPAWRPAWSFHSATLVGSEVFIIGALRGVQSNSIVVYNIVNKEWSIRQIAAGSNFAIGSHRAVRVGAHILLMSMDCTPLSRYVVLSVENANLLSLTLSDLSSFHLDL